MSPTPLLPPGPPPPPRGCICPPGANLTCESPTCPRKWRPSISTPRVNRIVEKETDQ